ncbi:MAG TPA: hypothetical protein VGF89_08845 [Steroidobacteraceae bacterium]|jgi:hypothetical protein
MRIAAVILWVTWSALGAALPAAELPRVPVAACPENEQPGAGRMQAAQSMPVDVSPAIAAQLAYYRAEGTPGVYAPQRWSCHGWSGSNGSILLVTPKALEPPYFPLPSITGPAVMIQSSPRETSGRFHVAIVAAQLFPLVAADFITQVRQEHLIPDNSFSAEHDADDELQYLSDRLVQYSTPANHSGLGTQGMLEVSNLPIRGLSILSLEDSTDALTEVRIRLAPALSPVAAAVLQLETACIQRRAGCRSVQ